MTWHWDTQWLLNLTTIALIGVVALAKVVALIARNKGRRRDRLVNGLIGWNGYLTVIFLWGATAQIALLPPPQGTVALTALRIGGIAAGLVTLFALRTAPPLWEPAAMQHLRDQVADLSHEHDIIRAENAALKAENDALRTLTDV